MLISSLLYRVRNKLWSSVGETPCFTLSSFVWSVLSSTRFIFVSFERTELLIIFYQCTFWLCGDFNVPYVYWLVSGFPSCFISYCYPSLFTYTWSFSKSAGCSSYQGKIILDLVFITVTRSPDSYLDWRQFRSGLN